MPQTEMLRPDGNSRIVVDDSELDAFVAAGYHRIDSTDVEANLSLQQAGLSPLDSAGEKTDAPDAPDTPDDDEKSGGNVTASSTDVKARDAIAEIAKLDSVEAVKAYADKDVRLTVIGAAESRVEELE